jgi:hypothetical protein
MNSDSDALSWEGDDDGAAVAGSPRRPADRRAGAGADAPDAHGPADADPDPRADAGRHAAQEPERTDGAAEREGLSTAMLLTAGIVGGVYLLYCVGWVVGGLRLKPLANLIVADAMYVPWFVLAVAAPPLWFLASWVLTRGRAAWIRVTMLLLGVVLLVPWPFVTVGVIGS